MKLKNIVVQFTVTVPELEVDKERGLQGTKRDVVNFAATRLISATGSTIEHSIKDCPDYPALCD